MGDDAGPMLRPSPQMPMPDSVALAASGALTELICTEIAASGGWIPFARYMQLALYSPRLGYYTGGAEKFGPSGDFVTAPSLGPLFAQTLARQVAELIHGSAPEILEFGAGGGELAADLLSELARLGCPVGRYAILEPGPELRDRQRSTIERLSPDSIGKVAWLDRLPERFRGVMIANEVVDAMPVHALAWRTEGVFERGVTIEGGNLTWGECLASGQVLAAARALPISPPFASEIGLPSQGWMGSIGACLEKGALLIIDYGFPASEYYHPQRSGGTLMCHYRHYAHLDPFVYPGLQDITAHIDFSALAQASVSAGLDVLGYASQTNFLVNCGITEVLDRTDADDARRYAPLAASAHKLLSPAEMGELFKVLCVGRGMPSTPMGFARGDRSHTL